jgi:DegV family protein with EDD domain
VEVFDSRAASLGHGEMARVAAAMRDRGDSLEAILRALATIRDTNYVLFTVGTMEYLQKGGRIGRASALLGSLLNIKPILTLEDGRIAPLSRARGVKKAQQEMVDRFKAYVDAAAGPVTANLIHIQDQSAAEGLRAALAAAGITYTLAGVHEIGAVVGSHVGPNTFGIYAHQDVL